MRKYLSLVRFSHTIFAMPFAIIGFFLGIQLIGFEAFPWLNFVWMIACMVFARNAAMSFNRYLDREFDKANPRTANREIPAGVISPKNALTFTIVNSVLFIATTYLINDICFYLSPIALFVVLFYSYTKRFTALCHIVLGVGLALAPIGAFLVVTGSFDHSLVPILFSIVVLTWVSGFDIIYSLQDVDFDSGHKLHSIPEALGVKNALRVSALLHVISGSFVIIAGILGDFYFIYWIGAAIFIYLLIYQHKLVKPHDLSKVNMAFNNTNSIASFSIMIFTLLALWFF